jgi:hypothetical protein
VLARKEVGDLDLPRGGARGLLGELERELRAVQEVKRGYPIHLFVFNRPINPEDARGTWGA